MRLFAFHRLRPIPDIQPRNGGEVGITRDEGAVTESQSDRGNLHIDLLHRTPNAAQMGKDPPEFSGRIQIERPQKEIPQRALDLWKVGRPRLAILRTKEKFANHRKTSADAMSLAVGLLNARELFRDDRCSLRRGRCREDSASRLEPHLLSHGLLRVIPNPLQASFEFGPFFI